MSSVKDEIAKNLQYYRKKKNMTQKELADKIGVRHNSISSWENGVNSISIENLQKIADALGVDVFSLADFDTATKMLEDDINRKEEPAKPEEQEPAGQKTLSTEEKRHIKKYRLLNEAGKQKTDEYMDLLLGNEDFRKSEKLLEVAARSGDHLQVPDNGALDDMVVSYPDDL